MSGLKKVLKWTGIILLFFIVALFVTVQSRQKLTYDAPYPNITASKDSSVIARGKHLVFSSAHCINCHNNNNPDSLFMQGEHVPLSGAVAFRLPVGTIYSKNITPDNETGIGKYSDQEIARSLRYGVKPDGRVVFDFMQFHNMSDEDLTAVISYLRVQEPVYNKVPGNELNFVGKAVNAFMVKPVGPDGEIPKTVIKDTSAAYGKYLAINIAECKGCHTQRDMAGKFIGEPFGGGAEIEGYITPNLTPDPSGRISKWTKENFINRFRQGKLIPGTPMPWNSYARMTDDELTAVYNFLKTTAPVKTVIAKK